MFCVYFPALFPESGWDYPLSRGKTRSLAIENAEKELACALAGFIYDNEKVPGPIPIPSNRLSKEMELIKIETSLEQYAEEIEEHLKGRHWHIGYYVEESDEYFEAIGFKNEQGNWDIFYSEEKEDSNEVLLFTVKLESEAYEKFKQFVENLIIKRRGELE
ncbi:type II toxin-antitoxin system HicB family antitoxin [Bacillus sp. YZJH907-2]|uniref:Type II toxin-antitoxin system HicB family antitoxin n=2 Tax=Halalkalibacter suaedae TaxID=2822140 RepID=A0A941APT8_9BACI|nr:type II toxin-antitoxin system HicB family antitoxin [Bacillus suaedae]MBP3951867.1 type II toxin-antitoxin system HicB family antitoxin [Bacillus suaedae]